MTVTVIIPNWNGVKLLPDCLKSLSKQSFKDFEILVVDNGSTDNSIKFIGTNFPQVKIIKLDKNYGFAKAINAGVLSTKADFVTFLNNDTEVDKNWLMELVKTIKKDNKLISVNSKLLNFYDRKLIDGVGITINEVGQARSVGWNEKDNGQYQKELYIFGATGGASIFRRKEFIKLGMFDENFFMYSEEVDFAFRAQFAGFKSIYSPKAVIFHKHKASSGKFPAKVEYWQFKNMYQVIIKNFPTILLFKNWRLLKIILVYFNTFLYQIKSGYYWPPILVSCWLFLHLPQLLLKRHEVQKNIKVDLEYIDSFFTPKRITFWKLR